jgi:hypothetical protein
MKKLLFSISLLLFLGQYKTLSGQCTISQTADDSELLATNTAPEGFYFTSCSSGAITSVDVKIGNTGNSNVTLELYEGKTGCGILIASKTGLNLPANTITTIDLTSGTSGTPNVTSSNSYHIVYRPSSGSLGVRFLGSNPLNQSQFGRAKGSGCGNDNQRIPYFVMEICPEIFEGPGADFFDNTNWCDGSSPLGCGGNSGIEIIIGADCETASCGLQTDFHHKLTINSGVTFTSNLTAGQHIMKGPNGELTNNGTMEIDRTFQVAAGSTHYNNGTINVNASTFWVNSGEGPVTMQNTGTININSGGSFRDVVSNGSTLDNDNMIIINSGGWVDFDGTNAVLDNSGIITVNGTLNINSGCVNTGTINGSGTLISSSADLAGTIQPGNSVGILNTTNDVTFSGEIDMEITGRGDSDGGVAGTDFDQISSTNAATITLENATVDLIFTGTNFYNGDTYTLFDAGTVTIVGTLSITNNNGYIIQHQGNGVFLIFSGALPVELIDFTARENDQTVILQWRTASELNNHGFQAQRSTDGKKWQNLAFLLGHGTTHEEQSYTYTDERPLPGLNYYRLRQEDFDGQFEYSQIVSIKMRNGGSGIRLFPNPATHSVTLALETDYDGEATLTLHDITGKRVRTQVLPLEGGTFRSSIELAGLPAGVYLAEVQAGREQWQERLVVE